MSRSYTSFPPLPLHRYVVGLLYLSEQIQTSSSLHRKFQNIVCVLYNVISVSDGNGCV
jgi:hypothetical protein